MQNRTAGLKLVLSHRTYGIFVYGVLCTVGGLRNEPSINSVACGFLQHNIKIIRAEIKLRRSPDVLLDTRMAVTPTLFKRLSN
jgi:hypothetical protein